MSGSVNRRQFVTAGVTAGLAAGLGDFGPFQQLPPVRAADAKITPAVVPLSPDVEPLVKWLEETPREKLLDGAAAHVKEGVPYGRLLGALLLAGVRGIKPRPVGFKFHAVLVINSAHLAALAAPDSERWLPLFWAMDNYKSSQAQNKKESDGWMMPAVDEAKLPSANQAKARFVEAMDAWDEEGADRAIAALVRSAGAAEIIELFWRYGARDFRDIGHKAIYVANSWRALQTVGWRHAEPVMRSLAFALLEHEGESPAKRDAEQDRPWRENVKRAAKMRADWFQGKTDAAAGADLLATLRTATPSDGAEKIVDLINKGVASASVWDGLFLCAGELLMQQPGIVGLHCVTSINALHFAYRTSGNDETRRIMMLQGAAFLALFKKSMLGRGKIDETRKIDRFEKAEVKATGAEAIEEIFADLPGDKMKAAGKALALTEGSKDAVDGLMTAARRLIFAKGTDSHDYKFSSAALEDYYHASPEWRARFLASSVFWLRGTGDKDNDLIKRARAALRA
jgi:hypothetical protein